MKQTLILGVLLFGLVACAQSAPDANLKPATTPTPNSSPSSPAEVSYQAALQDFEKVVDAANKEGSVVVYTPRDTAETDRYVAAFNRLYPKIKVQFIRMGGAAAMERVRAEQSTKNFTVDIYSSGSPSVRQMMLANLAQWTDPPALKDPRAKYIIEPRQDGKENLVDSFNRYFVMINTSLVQSGDEPRTWKDLANPKWKGQVVWYDPRLAGSGQVLFTTLAQAPGYGLELLSALAANSTIVSDYVEGSRMVARGEVAVMPGVMWPQYDTLRAGGAPVRLITPQDGTYLATQMTNVVKNAPHPNAALVFQNWFLSEDGQKMISEFNTINRIDVDAANKEVNDPTLKLLPNNPATMEFDQNAQKIVQEANRILGALGK